MPRDNPMLMGGATGLIAAGANVIVSVLTLFAGTIFSTSDTRLVRKIERDAALLKELPDAAKAVMEDLIAYEVQQHSDRRKQRAIRRVNKGAVAALIFIGVVTTPIAGGLAYLAVGHGWGWWMPFGLVTGFGLMLIAVGAGQIFYYGDQPAKSGGDNKAPKPARPS